MALFILMMIEVRSTIFPLEKSQDLIGGRPTKKIDENLLWLVTIDKGIV
jgi:hypothetical protein